MTRVTSVGLLVLLIEALLRCPGLAGRLHPTNNRKQGGYILRKFRRAYIAAGSAATFLLATATGATATTSPAVEDIEISFGYFEGEGFDGVYSSILEGNDPATASAFFRDAADSVGDVPVPGLESVPDADASKILTVAAESAAQNEDLPSEIVSDLPGGEAQPFTTQVPVSPLSLDTTPVIGAPINDGFSWQYAERYNWSECTIGPFGCEIVDWIDIRLTTDPGNTGSRTSVNLSTLGTTFTGIEMWSTVYGNGSQLNMSSKLYWSIGHGIHYNSPHLSLTGKTFQARFTINIATPNGGDQTTYKTGLSAPCGDPMGGGWKCLFS